MREEGWYTWVGPTDLHTVYKSVVGPRHREQVTYCTGVRARRPCTMADEICEGWVVGVEEGERGEGGGNREVKQIILYT